MVGSLASGGAEETGCALDRLVDYPASWQITPDDLAEEFSGKCGGSFRWLNRERTRAAFSRAGFSKTEIDFTLFDGKVPIQEAVVDFDNGRLNVVTISIYNRGDGGTIDLECFRKLYQDTGSAISRILEVRPTPLRADKRHGLLREGYQWNCQAGLAVMEHDEGALRKESCPAFLRLRVAKKGATSGLAMAMYSRRGAAPARLSDLVSNVETDRDGNVVVSGLPMVDQGDKGYCVVASVQRLFEYYGIGADMHQIAEVAQSDPESGTSTLRMAKELKKFAYRFKTRLDVIGMLSGGPEGLVEVKRDFVVGGVIDQRQFLKEIRSRIDAGLPLLWSLELGLFPEEPNLNPQTTGGHMRMIIGYNDRSERMIFSDSWGVGHERKTMAMEDAYRATTGLFALQPTVR